MKTTLTKGLWKTISFLAVVIISCIACEGCEEPLLKPKLEVSVENVADETAVVIASLIPNQPGTSISWRYKEAGSAYSKPQTLPTQFDGLETVKVDWQMSGLKANTTYTLEVVASNIAGSSLKMVNFSTGQVLAKIGLRQAEEVKTTSAKLTAWFIPNQPETEFTFEYREVNSNWASHTLSTKFSGTDSIKVSFELSSLKPNTLYSFRTRTKSLAGEKISDEVTFKTYAAMDIDGNGYYQVTIGNQIWLQSNLKTTRYANGDPIPNVTDQTTWESLTTPAMCWYDNDPKYGETYGALYNWYVGADPRPLIEGWSVPSHEDFMTLMNYLGGQDIAGGKLKSTGTSHWVAPNAGATNETGFTALPGGVRRDVFQSLNYAAVFYTKSIFMGMPNVSYGFSASNNNSILLYGGSGHHVGRSLRLIKK